MTESFLDGRVILHYGNALVELALMDDNSIDSGVTDPPYHLSSIVKRFGPENAAPAKSDGATGVYKRASTGFMGQRWDGGDVAFRPDVWAEMFRVLKPGAHCLAFCIPKHVGKLQLAMEQAGFQFRDVLVWCFATGFPKSHNVARNIAKIAPDEVAEEFEGQGTALKPAIELLVLARKPLSEKTVAANVLRWGTGGLNIDACRIEIEGGSPSEARRESARRNDNAPGRGEAFGRWPANLVHDGSAEVVAAFPDSDVSGTAKAGALNKVGGAAIWGNGNPEFLAPMPNDSGSAARFFYTAKADADDRLGSKHPTVKPVDLMQWLVRLVTPKGGTVLDPFAGTGTTGEAAWREGVNAVLIEREESYCADIRRRMALVLAGPDERARETVKAKKLPYDPGPLFAGTVTTMEDDHASQHRSEGSP